MDSKFDERVDLIFKDHTFDTCQRATEASILDFQKTFHPELIFDGSKEEGFELPLKLLIWDEAGNQVLGFVNGNLCGKKHELFQHGAYAQNPTIGFAYSHNFVFRIEELAKQRPLLHVRFGSDSKVQILSDFDSIKYKIFVQNGSLVLEGICKPSFPN